MRSACNACHRGKLRCSGGTPCSGCYTSGRQCSYSLSDPLGRPKGGKNKRVESEKHSHEKQTASGSSWEHPVDSSDEASRGSHPHDENLQLQHIQQLDDHRQRDHYHAQPTRPQQPALHHTADLTFGQAFRGNMQAIGSSADLASLTDVVLAAESRPRTPNTPNKRQLNDYFDGSDGARNFSSLSRNDDSILVRPAGAMADIEMETNWQSLLQDSWDSDVPSELEQHRSRQWSGRDTVSWTKTLEVSSRPSSLPTTDSTAPSTAPDSSTSCTCLQTQTNLLGYLREVEKKVGTNVPVGALLKATRRGLAAWAELVHCDRACLGGQPDEEAVLLVALGLRKTLRLFEAYSQPKQCTNELAVPFESLASRASSSASLTPSSRSSSAASFVQVGEQAASLAIGEYLLEEEEENMVGDMLAFQNLNRIRRLLSVLLSKVTTCVRGLSTRRESDLEVVQDMLRKLTIVADLQARTLQRKQEVHNY